MKKIVRDFLILALLFQLTALSAQDNYVYFSKTLPAAAYQEMKFRLTAFVRTEGEEEDAAARLWVATNKSGEDMKLSTNVDDTAIRTSQWKSFVVEGVIDGSTENIAFGLLLQYNGKFYFDDLVLSVETKKNKWTTLYKNDFEGTDTEFIPGNLPGRSKINPGYSSTLTATDKHQGRKSLLITGKDVPNFGVNSNVGRYANVNGIKLYYEVYGSGYPLLVLHGNGGSISGAASHYPELMKHYKVIAVDTRGHGKSTDTDAPLTFEQLAADFNSLLDELQLDSVFVWGHSDGAILGLIMAMDHPKKVKRLLAYGANLQPDSTAIYYWAVNAIKKYSTEVKDPKEKKQVILMVENPHIPYERLSSIQAPVLVMAGDRDIITAEHTLKIFQHIPKSQLCILPGATHNGSWEQQKLFHQFLIDFFEKPFSMPDTKEWFK